MLYALFQGPAKIPALLSKCAVWLLQPFMHCIFCPCFPHRRAHSFSPDQTTNVLHCTARHTAHPS